MNKLTKTEEIIVFTIVRLNSKEKLKSELDEWVDGGMSQYIDSVRSIYQLISVEVRDDIDVQYLNYSINNYDNILIKDFSNPIERVESYDYGVNAVETETISSYYTANFESLPSLFDEKVQDVGDNFWEYDPERETMDYLDSNIDRIDFDSPDISKDSTFNNIIK